MRQGSIFLILAFISCGRNEVHVRSDIPLSRPLITAEKQVFHDSTLVTAEFRMEGASLHYTTDGNDPTDISPVMDGPVTIRESGQLRIRATHPDWAPGEVVSVDLFQTRITASGALLDTAPSASYPGTGASTLVDHSLGSFNFRDGKWLGFQGDDLVATLDLGRSGTISELRLHYLSDLGSYIFPPSEVDVSYSTDSLSWSELETVKVAVPAEMSDPETGFVNVHIGAELRYLRIRARNTGTCPEWHPGAGEKSWLFVDEIIIQ